MQSVRAAGGGRIRMRRARWNVNYARMASPLRTSIHAAWTSVKVSSWIQMLTCLCVPIKKSFHHSIHVVFTSIVLNGTRNKGRPFCVCMFPAQCQPGSSSRSGLETCESCPLGEYQPGFGSQACLSCPLTTTTVNRGALDINECGGKIINKQTEYFKEW